MVVAFEEFLEWPLVKVRPLAPETVIYAASGTRRSAVLAGISLEDDTYAQWTHAQMINSCDIIFDHGTRNVITVLATPSQFAEGGSYGERLMGWIQWGLTSQSTLREFSSHDWNIRVIADQSLPQLLEIDNELQAQNQEMRKHTLWFIAIRSESEMWSGALQTIIAQQAHTLSDAIHAVYGKGLSPATLFLGFGKPAIPTSLAPPLLGGDMHCYWSQKPGYSLDRKSWRAILHDYLHLRAVDSIDRQQRAKAISDQPLTWNDATILGLGARSGDNWYPRQFK